MRSACFIPVLASLTLLAHPAAALQLDSLLPASIPGFNTEPGVSILTRLHPEYQNPGIQLGGLAIDPALASSAGYDSSPNGVATTSPFVSLTPSLRVQDTALGLGAYGSWQITNFTQQPSQNNSAYTLAVGEAALLAQNTLIIGLANLRSQQTGFSVTTLNLNRPATITGTQLRARDSFTSGLFTLTPEVTAAQTSYTQGQTLTARQLGGGITMLFTPDAIASLVTSLHATSSRYNIAAENADDVAALIGMADHAENIWNVRLLAGVAARAPSIGKPRLLPIAEAAASWLPDELDSFTLSAAHEIEDPTQLDTASYTRTELQAGWDRELRRNIILTSSASTTKADFFSAPLKETIFTASSALVWHLNRHLKFAAAYQFNDRQANILRAANEHVLTLTLTWMP